MRRAAFVRLLILAALVIGVLVTLGGGFGPASPTTTGRWAPAIRAAVGGGVRGKGTGSDTEVGQGPVSPFGDVASILAQEPPPGFRQRGPRMRRGWLPELGRGGDAGESIEMAPYDGRFAFARIRFATGRFCSGMGGREPPWAHDYPRSERNLMKILADVSYIEPFVDGGNAYTLDDPRLFRFPLLYIAEPGCWAPTDAEVENLRAYLLKGGLLILDDMAGWNDLDNAAAQLGRVLPGHRLIPLDVSHPVFSAFFVIESLPEHHPYRYARSEYYGIFENNDPARRLMVIINHNNDISEYWEYADTGWAPIDLTNEAFKLGVNFIVYAMTH
ncbi:MAG TPA: DUF4159 domain-containing protein [Longimicrobiales bacterium]|nr:DUF4159 domain-containing protein [Longimicrobiales bacterium]